MKNDTKTKTEKEPVPEIDELRDRLREAEETLAAIRGGEVDALVVSGTDEEGVYTLTGAMEFYRVFVESMNEGALTLRPDGAIYYCNRRFSEIVRKPLEKIVGSSIYEFVMQEEREKISAIIDQGTKNGSKGEFSLETADGNTVPVHLSVSPLRLNENIVICAVVTDLTEQKNLNKELQDFVFIAAHDLREPLRKIRSFGDLLLGASDPSLGENARDYIRRMQNASARMQQLLDSLLSYSRVITKAGMVKKTNLNKSLQSALSNLEVAVREKNARFEIEELPEIEADRVQAIQLFQNLIENSLKFTREGVPPDIRIHGESLPGEKQSCRIRVEDNGIGFEEKYLEKIFMPFQRLHGKQSYGGTGMGLAICRKVVERHDGEITARSRVGEGSTFIVTLPVAQNEQSPAAGGQP